MYCFADVQGFSKFSSYTGNGVADGTFVYLGFRPAWILLKNCTDSNTSWVLFDNKRSTFNPRDDSLSPDTGYAEEEDYEKDRAKTVTYGKTINQDRKNTDSVSNPFPKYKKKMKLDQKYAYDTNILFAKDVVYNAW